MHDLVMEERPFDTTGDYGSNVWETSELRKYLQSEEFRERYKKLIPYLTKVVKENNSGYRRSVFLTVGGRSRPKENAV